MPLTAAPLFGRGALLYFMTEELLVECITVPDRPLKTASFIGGFILLPAVTTISARGGRLESLFWGDYGNHSCN